MEQQQIDPGTAQAYQKVVMAGLKALYSPKIMDLVKQGLAAKAPLAQKAATQIAGLLKLLDDKAGMKIPKQVLVPAGVALLVDLYKFLLEAGQITEKDIDIDKASAVLVQLLVQEYHLLDQQSAQAAPQQAQAAPVAPTPQPAAPAQPGLIGAQ